MFHGKFGIRVCGVEVVKEFLELCSVQPDGENIVHVSELIFHFQSISIYGAMNSMTSRNEKVTAMSSVR
jgi:hypothetical protein